MKSDNVFRMSLVMAVCTQANQIGWRIIEFISIYVMNMKIISPSLSRFTTMLASPFITIFNIFANSFPIMGIGPFSNTTFPGRVFRTTNSARAVERLGLRTALDTKLFHKLGNYRNINAKLISNILHGSLISRIFFYEPIDMFIRQVFSIMTNNINIPFVFSLIPNYMLITTTFTEWGLFSRWRYVFDRLCHNSNYTLIMHGGVA